MQCRLCIVFVTNATYTGGFKYVCLGGGGHPPPRFFQLIPVVFHKDDFALVSRSKKLRLLYMFSFHAFQNDPGSTYSGSLALSFYYICTLSSRAAW